MSVVPIIMPVYRMSEHDAQVIFAFLLGASVWWWAPAIWRCIRGLYRRGGR